MIAFHLDLNQIRYNIFSKGFCQPALHFLIVIRCGVFVLFLNGPKTIIMKETISNYGYWRSFYKLLEFAHLRVKSKDERRFAFFVFYVSAKQYYTI